MGATSRRIQSALVELVDGGQELPGVADGFLLEVVAEGPVAEHLEEGVVVARNEGRERDIHILANIFEVVVLAAGTNAFLGVAGSLQVGEGGGGVDLVERRIEMKGR